jgi:phosphoribosyl 1,2-cyclic phosphodiesterase
VSFEPKGNTADSETFLDICMLASGSKGNALYVSDGSTSILVDAGLSGIETERRMNAVGISPEDLDAIVVSHEHSDHIHGVGVLSRRYRLPVYINTKTEKASPQVGRMHARRHFRCGSPFKIKALTIHPFSLSHDAKDPVGFTIRRNHIKIGVATDLGIATSVVKTHLKDCGLLVVEANHDPVMLENGPYPWPLKQRIKSRAGHLSNQDSKRLLQELLHDRLQYIILAHLSEKNNTPEKALNEIGPALNNNRARLTVADQHRCGPLLRLK